MTREQLEALILTAPSAEGRARQHRRLHGIEDYLHIGGPRMSAPQAAARIGRSPRTVERYRRVLREAQ